VCTVALKRQTNTNTHPTYRQAQAQEHRDIHPHKLSGAVNANHRSKSPSSRERNVESVPRKRPLPAASNATATGPSSDGCTQYDGTHFGWQAQQSSSARISVDSLSQYEHVGATNGRNVAAGSGQIRAVVSRSVDDEHVRAISKQARSDVAKLAGVSINHSNITARAHHDDSDGVDLMPTPRDAPQPTPMLSQSMPHNVATGQIGRFKSASARGLRDGISSAPVASTVHGVDGKVDGNVSHNFLNVSARLSKASIEALFDQSSEGDRLASAPNRHESGAKSHESGAKSHESGAKPQIQADESKLDSESSHGHARGCNGDATANRQTDSRHRDSDGSSSESDNPLDGTARVSVNQSLNRVESKGSIRVVTSDERDANDVQHASDDVTMTGQTSAGGKNVGNLNEIDAYEEMRDILMYTKEQVVKGVSVEMVEKHVFDEAVKAFEDRIAKLVDEEKRIMAANHQLKQVCVSFVCHLSDVLQ
jgi:hypothetical protein